MLTNTFAQFPYDPITKPEDAQEFLRPQRVEDRPTVQLFLIKPRYIPDPVVRPLTYQFGTAFQEELEECLYANRSRSTMSGGFGVDVNHYVPSMYHADECLKLGDNPIVYGAGKLNQRYRFILILKNVSLHARSALGAIKNQLVYVGWCDDEPVSFSGYLNPACTLIFTHVTYLDVDDVLTRNGYDRHAYTKMDCDVLSNRTQYLDSNSMSPRDYIITPEQIASNSSLDEYDRYGREMVTRVPELSQQPKSTLYYTANNSPRQQLSRMIMAAADSAFKGMEVRRYNPVSRGMARYSLTGESNNISDVRSSLYNFQAALDANGGHPDLSGMGPDITESVTMRQLMSLFPNIQSDTTVIEADSAYIDVLNERTTSATVIASSFIKITVPAVFADFAFSNVSFRYATYDPVKDRYLPMKDRKPIWMPYFVMPFIDEPKYQTESRLRLAFDKLHQQVFKVCEEIMGYVDCLVDYKASDATIVQVQLPDSESAINHGYVIHQGELGGLISPMIGDLPTLQTASRLITDMTDFIDGSVNARISEEQARLQY